MDAELFTEIRNMYFLMSKVREDCLVFLMDLLRKNHFEISWEDDEDIGESITISYDGGNHPEDGSNVYSEVYGISLSKEGINVNIEDDPKYPIGNVTTTDLVSICEFIDSYREELSLNN